MLIVLLALCAALLAFTYAGYPLLMAWRARRAPAPAVQPEWLPSVSAVLVAHGQPQQLAAKVANLLALDYPPERFRLRIACDGCDRRDAAMARRLAGPRVTVRCFAARRGKSACLGDLLREVDEEVVLFCDVRQRIAPDALRRLLQQLADPEVGAVSGELMLERGDGSGGGDGYWRYEKWIRRNESASGSVPGVTGALYVARRALLPAVPAGLILDDVWIPLQIAARGARIRFAADALAWDTVAGAAHEDHRKRRTLAGNFQLLALDPGLLLPWRHPLGWRLWGHKWLRLAAPWLLLFALGISAALATDGGLWAWPFLAQCAFYAAAALGALRPRGRLLCLAATFVRLNLCAARAPFDFARNPQRSHLWARAETATRRPT